MFRLSCPPAEAIDRAITEASREPIPDLGLPASPVVTAPGYRIDHEEHPLGHGQEIFDVARDALLTWKHYDQGWIRVFPSPPEIQVGITLAVAARAWGLWSLNLCRIACVIEEEGDAVRRSGFAYRTLERHVERGEAVFVIEHRRADNSIWLVIHTASRIHHWLPRLVAPLAHLVQRQARIGAANNFRRIVTAGHAHP